MIDTRLYTDEDFQRYEKRISVLPQGVDGHTDIHLTREMVSKIDIDWSNPKLRILDPDFTYGSFLFSVYLKLKEFHSDEHIFNNMLFGICRSKGRLLMVKNKLPIKNLFHDDFLKPSPKLEKILNMKKFDVIIGNPPFSSNPKEPVRLWASFIENGMDMLKQNGYLSFVTPSSWMSSTNSVYNLLKSKIHYVNVSKEVGDYFGSTGGTQKFVYFISNKSLEKKCVTKFDDNIEITFNPTNTPYSPIKSSSYFIYDLVERLSNSDFQTFDWNRFDKIEKSSGVVVPMAKAATHEIKFHEVDDFEIGRYKVNVDEELGKIISKNLNTKTYQILRWVLRSGPALAGNFKLLPIPHNPMDDDELLEHIGMSDDAKNFIKSYVI